MGTRATGRIKRCAFCRAPFQENAYYLTKRFCSPRCRGKWQYQNNLNRPPLQYGATPWNKGIDATQDLRLRRMSIRRRGKGNPLYKRGWYVDGQGYKRVLVGSQTYEMEHRLVAEKSLGRRLSPREVVHHKNSDRLDNRPENLQVFPNNKEHARFHKRSRNA